MNKDIMNAYTLGFNRLVSHGGSSRNASLKEADEIFQIFRICWESALVDIYVYLDSQDFTDTQRSMVMSLVTESIYISNDARPAPPAGRDKCSGRSNLTSLISEMAAVNGLRTAFTHVTKVEPRHGRCVDFACTFDSRIILGEVKSTMHSPWGSLKMGAIEGVTTFVNNMTILAVVDKVKHRIHYYTNRMQRTKYGRKYRTFAKAVKVIHGKPIIFRGSGMEKYERIIEADYSFVNNSIIVAVKRVIELLNTACKDSLLAKLLSYTVRRDRVSRNRKKVDRIIRREEFVDTQAFSSMLIEHDFKNIIDNIVKPVFS